MKLFFSSAFLLASLSLLLASPVKRKTAYPGANELADQYPHSITGVYNASYFILNFPAAKVASVLPLGVDLLPYSVVQKSLPDQPAGTHPIIIKIGMDVDVSAGSLAPFLHFDFHNSHVGVPFVDKSNDGSTGFIYDIWLGSSSLAGVSLTLISAQEAATYAMYTPDDQAFQAVPGASGHFSSSAINAITKNPIYDLEYAEIPSTLQAQSTLLPSQVESIANQGQFQRGLCTFDAQVWNLSGSNPHIIQATSLTLYEPLPSFLVGTYTDVFGVRVPQGGFIETVSRPCV